jgi:hypothetical protein
MRHLSTSLFPGRCETRRFAKPWDIPQRKPSGGSPRSDADIDAASDGK